MYTQEWDLRSKGLLKLISLTTIDIGTLFLKITLSVDANYIIL